MAQQWIFVGAILAICFGIVIIAALAAPIFFRYITRGKMVAIMHGNRTLGSYLLPEDPIEHCLWLGKESDSDRERYEIDPKKVFWVRYPGMLPWFLTIPIRALEYVKGNPVPWDPEVTHKSSITAKSFRLITDENMLANAWKDVRTGLGLQAKGSKVGNYLMYGVVIAVGLSLLNLWLTSQLSGNQKVILNALHEIYKLAGGQ